MSMTESAALGVESPLRIRVVYRSGEGETQFDWPRESIPEALNDPEGVLWVDILDPDDNPAYVEGLFRDVFHFHPLSIEDALTESHVPRLDDWGHYLYVVFHTLDFDPDTDQLRLRELDIFLGGHYLVTYHSQPIPVLDRVLKCIERDHGNRTLSRGADHLLYELLDQGVAEYLEAIDHLDQAIDEAQDEVFHRPNRDTLQRIFVVKRSATRLQRIIAPQREVLNKLARDNFAQIDEADRVYFRDVYDHLVRQHDMVETLRDLISGAMDTYLSAISNRTNDIMKALTVVTVLFLPLNFLVGFFGMNFFGSGLELADLGVPHFLLFLLALVVMVGSTVFLGFWFKRRGWF